MRNVCLQIYRNNRICWKLAYFLSKIQILRVNNSRILTIKNAKFSSYYFYMNLNLWRDFQFCISVPLILTFLILNSFHTSFLCLSYKLWTGNSLLGQMISQTKTFKLKSFLPFNFAITKICVAVRLAEDGKRMGGI